MIFPSALLMSLPFNPFVDAVFRGLAYVFDLSIVDSILKSVQGPVYQRCFLVLRIKHVVVERSQGWAVAVSVGVFLL